MRCCAGISVTATVNLGFAVYLLVFVAENFLICVVFDLLGHAKVDNGLLDDELLYGEPVLLR